MAQRTDLMGDNGEATHGVRGTWYLAVQVSGAFQSALHRPGDIVTPWRHATIFRLECHIHDIALPKPFRWGREIISHRDANGGPAPILLLLSMTQKSFKDNASGCPGGRSVPLIQAVMHRRHSFAFLFVADTAPVFPISHGQIGPARGETRYKVNFIIKAKQSYRYRIRIARNLPPV